MELGYRVSEPVSNAALNSLFRAAWPDHHDTDFEPILRQSLAYVCAYDPERLVGFVNVAWDGRSHAFLLDTTVSPDYQRQGIGQRLVHLATAAARSRGVQWLHVDYEPHLSGFYRGCGFRHTEAGVMRLNE